jgi:hypothetical protein
MVFNTMLASAIDMDDGTMRNSNLLPVKANGDVRLRSELSMRELRQGIDPDGHDTAGPCGFGLFALGNVGEDLGQLFAHEHRR